MNYFTQKYPYEERQDNLTARRRKRRMRKKPKRIKKGGGLSDLPGPFPSEEATRIREVAADIRAAEIADRRERLAAMSPRTRTEIEAMNIQRRKDLIDRRQEDIMNEGIRVRNQNRQREYLRAQRRAEAPARMGAPLRRAAMARDRLTRKRALDTELERINSRERALLKDIGKLDRRRRLTSIRDPAASHPRLPRERRRTKRKPGRRQQYEDMLLQDMNREIQRPVRFDQLERRIPYKPVRHTPDPRGEKDYLRPFPYELDIFGITYFSKDRAPIPGEYLTTRLDIPSEAGPYLEVGFKVPKNYDPSKKRIVKVEVTPLKGISYNYYNQAKFQTKKLLQKGYQKHKDRKKSLKSFEAYVVIPEGSAKGETIEQQVERRNGKKVLVHFKPPTNLPRQKEDRFAFDQRDNEHPISDELAGTEYPDAGLEYPIQLNLSVTPVSNAYRALEGTKKVGKGLKKGAYYGAVYGLGVPLYGLGLGAVKTAKLARQGIGAAGQAIGTAYQERNRSLEEFEAEVTIPRLAPAGSTHEDKVRHPHTGKRVKVRFTVPDTFPTAPRQRELYDDNGGPIRRNLAGREWVPQDADFEMRLFVTPISVGYRTKQGIDYGTRKLRQGAVGTAGLTGQALSAARQGIGNFASRKNRQFNEYRTERGRERERRHAQRLAERERQEQLGRDLRPYRTSGEGLFRRVRKGLGDTSAAASARFSRMTKKRKPVEEEVTMLSGFADSSEHSPEESGNQSSGFSRRSEPSRFQKLRRGAGELATGTLGAIGLAGQAIGSAYQQRKDARRTRRAQRQAERDRQEEEGVDIRRNRSSDEGLFSRLGTKLGNASTATRARLARMTKKRREEEEEGEELLPLGDQRDSSEYSSDESGIQSSGFSRRSEPDLRLNRTSDEGLFSRFGKRLGTASTNARGRLARMTRKNRQEDTERLLSGEGTSSSKYLASESGSQSSDYDSGSQPSLESLSGQEVSITFNGPANIPGGNDQLYTKTKFFKSFKKGDSITGRVSVIPKEGRRTAIELDIGDDDYLILHAVPEELLKIKILPQKAETSDLQIIRPRSPGYFEKAGAAIGDGFSKAFRRTRKKSAEESEQLLTGARSDDTRFDTSRKRSTRRRQLRMGDIIRSDEEQRLPVRKSGMFGFGTTKPMIKTLAVQDDETLLPSTGEAGSSSQDAEIGAREMAEAEQREMTEPSSTSLRGRFTRRAKDLKNALNFTRKNRSRLAIRRIPRTKPQDIPLLNVSEQAINDEFGEDRDCLFLLEHTKAPFYPRRGFKSIPLDLKAYDQVGGWKSHAFRMKIGGLPLYSSFKDSLTKGRSFTAAIDEFSPKGQGIVDNRMLIRLKDQNEYNSTDVKDEPDNNVTGNNPDTPIILRSSDFNADDLPGHGLVTYDSDYTIYWDRMGGSFTKMEKDILENNTKIVRESERKEFKEQDRTKKYPPTGKLNLLQHFTIFTNDEFDKLKTMSSKEIDKCITQMSKIMKIYNDEFDENIYYFGIKTARLFAAGFLDTAKISLLIARINNTPGDLKRRLKIFLRSLYLRWVNFRSRGPAANHPTAARQSDPGVPLDIDEDDEADIQAILADLNRRSVEVAGEAPASAPAASAPAASAPAASAPAEEAPASPSPPSSPRSSSDEDITAGVLRTLREEDDEGGEATPTRSPISSPQPTPQGSPQPKSTSEAGPSSSSEAGFTPSSGQKLATKDIKDMTEKERLFRAWKVIDEIISKEESDQLGIIEAKKRIDELYKKYSRLNRDSLLKLHGKEFMRKHYDQGFESLETKKKYWNICISILKQIKVLLDKYNLEGKKLIEILNKFLEQKSSVTTLDGYPEFPPEFVDLLDRYLRLSIQANVFVSLLGAQEEGSKAFKIKETVNIILDAEKEKFSGVGLYQLIYGLSKKVLNFEDHCANLFKATGKHICILDTKEIKRNMLEHNMSLGARYDDLLESIERDDNFDIDKLFDLNSTDSTRPQPAKTPGLRLRLPTSKSSSSKQRYSLNYPDTPSARPPMKAGPSSSRAEQSRLEAERGEIQDTPRAVRPLPSRARQTFTLRAPSSSSTPLSASPSQSPIQSPISQSGGKKKRKNKTKKRKNKRKRRTNKKNLFFYFK